MKHITSRENVIYKDALKLTRRKYRDLSGLFILEGIKPLRDAVSAGIKPQRVFIDEARTGDITEESWLAEMGDIVCLLSRELFKMLSDTENSQGVVSVMPKPDYSEQKLSSAFAEGNICVLDRLQDPGNIGTIIRTAEAAGYAGIAVIKGTADIYSPKVVRAAAGSLLRMPAVILENAGSAAELLHGLGKKITVTCLEDAFDYRDADLSEGIALVIGNEGQGVSREFKDLADMKVKIPMKGQIESLNAAVAAGILMYQASRR